MTNDEFYAINQQLRELRKQSFESPFGIVPQSIAFLENAIKKAVSIDDKSTLYSLMEGECTRSGNQNINLHFLWQRLQDLSNDPLSFIGLATVLAYDPNTQQEALTLVDNAVRIAKERDILVKYCFTSQARIAIQIRDYVLFNNALAGLIEDAANYRQEDNRLEFDFLDNIDITMADESLLSKYRELQSALKSS